MGQKPRAACLPSYGFWSQSAQSFGGSAWQRSARELAQQHFAEAQEQLAQADAKLMQAEQVNRSAELQQLLDQSEGEKRELRRQLGAAGGREQRMQRALDEAADVQELWEGDEG